MTSLLRIAAVSLATIVSSTAALAAPVTPTFDTFGSLPGATFGGQGIPNNAVAVTTLANGVVLGMTAHQRYTGPNLLNDGAGTFFAPLGVSQNSPSPANPYALWNVGFHISGDAVANYNYRLYFDTDPLAGTELSQHWSSAAFSAAGQDSWNLGMDFLEASGAFNPLQAGVYSFALVAFAGEAEVGRSAIVVNAGNAVPEPATLALVGLALAGAAAAGRRRRG